MTDTLRERVSFDSAGTRCDALLYRGTNGAGVVMAPGGGVTKEPGTDAFATRFHAAGYTVLAFDFRNFGGSGGRRRQVINPHWQTQDYLAALAFARTLPEVDPDRIALWGFSLSAGHLLRATAGTPVAAIIAQSPFVDGPASAPNALRHETFGVINRMPLLAAADVLGGFFGHAPRTVPLAGPRGTLAMLTTPDAQDADRALNPANAYPEWEQTVAARSVLRLLWYRPIRHAATVTVPALILIAQDDQSVLAAPARKAARKMSAAEVVELDGGHYTAFLDEHEHAVEAELDFLQRRI